MKTKNPISEAEAEVLKVLWDSDGSMTTAAICKEISDKIGWDRSTVRTLLRRLVEKGAALELKLEVLSYRPSLSEEEYRKTQTKSFLEHHYGGSAKRLVASLIQGESLSEKDIEELREFLSAEGKLHG